MVDGVRWDSFANPNYGALDGLGIALFVLVVILADHEIRQGLSVANVAVLLGIVAGAIVAALLGKMQLRQGGERVAGSAWSMPFQFGLPTFDLVAIAHDVPGDDRGDDRIRSACSSRSAR